ncbi:hypothetical protein XF24_00774 [candidate division SR1 bacterium Aalborg_AAW-1]|nr:hypothetical protein XF24_00774 [candidate division SR1 bacterium Aalborg_AAW-1]
MTLSPNRIEELRILPKTPEYKGVQDLFDVLSIWQEEEREHKNDYEYEALQQLSTIMISQTQVLNILQGWDRSGYESLNEEQQDQYNTLIDVLLGNQTL